MRTSLIRRVAASLLALSLVSAAPLAVQAQENETQEPITLTQEHVTLEHTEYEYTGSPIEPNVTVRVEGTLLTLDQHYRLSFADNTQVGQAKVTVSGPRLPSQANPRNLPSLPNLPNPLRLWPSRRTA